MALLYSVFGFLFLNPCHNDEPDSFDLLGSLPIEMSLTILRALPGKDLVNVACVCKHWRNLCKSDKILRQRVRLHLRQVRKARISAIVNETFTDHVADLSRNRPAMNNIVNTMAKRQLPSTYFGRNGMRITPFKRYKKTMTPVKPKKRSTNNTEFKGSRRLRV